MFCAFPACLSNSEETDPQRNIPKPPFHAGIKRAPAFQPGPLKAGMYQALFGVAIGVADFELDTQSYLPEQGENKGTHGVNADGDADLT